MSRIYKMAPLVPSKITVTCKTTSIQIAIVTIDNVPVDTPLSYSL